MFWRKKKKNIIVVDKKKVENYPWQVAAEGESVIPNGMPTTIATLRLEGGAKDIGAEKAQRMYNSQKVRVQNQWINPLLSINSGNGTAHYSSYLYQTVNYYECYALAQDGLFANIFRILSETPFAKGGEIVGLEGDNVEEEKDAIENLARKYEVFSLIKGAVKSSFTSGGCLIYMNFGLSQAELERPLNLKHIDMRKFKGFVKIDPINVCAIDVNTSDPSIDNYMKPSKWYVVGLGTVDASHFLHFEQNTPEKMMKPLCMYFGFPLTLLIKNDIANATLASQGLANIINRVRYTYLKTDLTNLINASDFRNRLEWMAKVQDNFSVCPIKIDEDVIQQSFSLGGYAESVQLFYQLISSKTAIPQAILLGSGTHGFSDTQEGERRNWYDECHRIQDSVKAQLLTMLGIVAGVRTGVFQTFNDFMFFPLEESNEKETAENLRSAVDVARSLIEFGCEPKGVLDWLKSNKKFSLDEVSLTDEEGEMDLDSYDDITDEALAAFDDKENN